MRNQKTIEPHVAETVAELTQAFLRKDITNQCIQELVGMRHRQATKAQPRLSPEEKLRNALADRPPSSRILDLERQAKAQREKIARSRNEDWPESVIQRLQDQENLLLSEAAEIRGIQEQSDAQIRQLEKEIEDEKQSTKIEELDPDYVLMAGCQRVFKAFGLEEPKVQP